MRRNEIRRQDDTRRTLAFYCGAAVFLAIGGTAARRAESSLVGGGASEAGQLQRRRMNNSAASSLFGEFRASAADMLWQKADGYLHNGVEMRALTNREKSGTVDVACAGHTGEADAEGVRAHGEETTVVPKAAHDWRGAFGAVEREVQPYQDMRHHTHRDPKETLPLFRLMTASNPHFVAGYVTGAALIAREPAQYPLALDFLREGERNNPQSLEIETEMGEMLTAKMRRYNEALPHLRRALTMGAARDFTSLTGDERDAYEAAFRWTVLNRREVGDAVAAHTIARDGLRRFPDDVVCRHYISNTKKD